MAHKDLKSFIEELKDKDQLKEITVEVNDGKWDEKFQTN